ncbi:hypothetical protein FRB90_004732 [Tulasnella sp. 427]|nr:hypothetical protein FRB90_004732 [Tulasnella sp. 427]
MTIPSWIEEFIQQIKVELVVMSQENVTNVLDSKSQAMIIELANKPPELYHGNSKQYELLAYLMTVSERTILGHSKDTGPLDLHLPHELFQLASMYTSLLDTLVHNNSASSQDEAIYKAAIARLDRAIILTGGDRYADLLEDMIKCIQDAYLPLETPQSTSAEAGLDEPGSMGTEPPRLLPLSSTPIPAIDAPSLSSFQRERSAHPFIIQSYASKWPALTGHQWRSLEYLRGVGGRGRVVPVEVGGDYRASGWTQTLMDWEEFLEDIFPPTDSSKSKLYLAQHSLLRQFPALRRDMEIPDYVYAELDPPNDWATYKPPMNDEQLVINAWLGPQETISPAHFDPFFNCFGEFSGAHACILWKRSNLQPHLVQVVGRKTVWIAPPSVADFMYTSGADIKNTSQVDVFADKPNATRDWPEFVERVVPHAMSFVLEPGDLLFLPPGWWHAMRSEELSFSVSFWF